MAIEQAMRRLGDEQRAVVALVLVEGLPYKEAAEVLGIPVGTLTSRLARARETLQACSAHRETPMNAIDDELLMAYADGELDADAARRASAPRSMPIPAWPRESTRIAQLRRAAARAYAPALDEPVPDRAAAAALQPTSAPVDRSGGAARCAPANTGVAHRRARRLPAGPQWGGIAASLLIGVLVGRVMDIRRRRRPGSRRLPGPGRPRRRCACAVEPAGQRAAGDQPIRLQISFVDRDGRYCRTFTTPVLAGLACRDGDEWAVQTLLDNSAGDARSRRCGRPPAACRRHAANRSTGGSRHGRSTPRPNRPRCSAAGGAEPRRGPAHCR